MTISDDILFPQIVSWGNLWEAYRKAAKRKRGRPSVAAFDYKLADNLLEIQRALIDETYRPGPYHHFEIHEPKRRLISAAPFRDRVVHHALCNVIEPLFEARFHPHSYANRLGKGTHRAVDQCQLYAQRYRYVLRMDIVKHFPSIDHAILKQQLFKVVKDTRTQHLIAAIIQSGAGVMREEFVYVAFPQDKPADRHRARGLPIGNLTSQFWSNCYLNPLDWFISRQLRCPAYLRYVDDFALFSNSKRQLNQWKKEIVQFLETLRLMIHSNRAQATPTGHGIPWLGFVVYPTHRLLKQRNVVKFQRRLERNISLYQQEQISYAELDATVQGWINHVRYADSWGLRRHLFQKHPI